jgi:AraC-like DNA-binding protein
MPHGVPDFRGLPLPLWAFHCSSDDTPLLPANCQAAVDRPSWLLFLVAAGTVPIRQGEQVHQLAAGECLLSPYPASNLAVLPGDRAWQAIAFGFIGFDSLVADVMERLFPARLPVGSWGERQLRQLADQEQLDLGLASAMRLVSGILANLIEHSVEREAAHPDSAVLTRVRQAMEQAVGGERSIQQIADELGISQGHLGRLCRRHLGMSAGRHLQECRMRRACELLRQLDVDIADIARRVGYNSTAAFSAAFKSAVGCVPTDYRNSRSIPLWESGT